MHRIECVKSVLKCLARNTLPAVVKPNWNQRKHSKALRLKLKGVTEDGERNVLSGEQYKVKKNHKTELSRPRKAKLAAQIKHDNRCNAKRAVIREGYRSSEAAQRSKKHSDKPCLDGVFFFGVIQCLDSQKSEQKCKHYILVERVKHRAAVYKVKRNFRNQTENQKPYCIFAEIRSM